MITKSVMTVLLTGFIAGILVTGAQILRVTPLIFQAENYELGEVAVPHTHVASGISHQHNLNGDSLDKHLQIKDVHDIQNLASIDQEQSWVPADGMERTFYTLVSNIITAIAFSLMLVSVYLLRGKPTGIGLLIESKTILLKFIAAVLIAVPHIIGAPHPHVFESNVPAELSAQFAVASLLTSVFFWMVLGAVSGYFYQKLVLESSRPLETVSV